MVFRRPSYTLQVLREEEKAQTAKAPRVVPALAHAPLLSYGTAEKMMNNGIM